MFKRSLLIFPLITLLFLVACGKTADKSVTDKQKKPIVSQSEIPDDSNNSDDPSAAEVLDSLHSKFDQSLESCQFDISIVDENTYTDNDTGVKSVTSGTMNQKFKYVDGKIQVRLDSTIKRDGGDRHITQVIWGNKGCNDVESNITSISYSSYIDSFKVNYYCRQDSSKIEDSTVTKENGNKVYNYTFADETVNESELYQDQKMKILLDENNNVISFEISGVCCSTDLSKKPIRSYNTSIAINSFSEVNIDISGYEEWVN